MKMTRSANQANYEYYSLHTSSVEKYQNKSKVFLTVLNCYTKAKAVCGGAASKPPVLMALIYYIILLHKKYNFVNRHCFFPGGFRKKNEI